MTKPKYIPPTTDSSGNPPPTYEKPNITYQGEQPKPTPWGQTSVYISTPRPDVSTNGAQGQGQGAQGEGQGNGTGN
ncbi:uncharacterized protein IL334_003170 [Kwoniella shivajii]|uniref:Uncharacterized protein n=1 Tax=Kwoniella shivajii TaxID=564305 RepID=A0ABZ1CWT1_9TREE|nr:hypothetical protein IL334_003170 [Kwoniella shivajii]